MSAATPPQISVSPAGGPFVVDEVGIESGLFGPFVLKSAYQPIYRLEADRLVPFAAEGLARPFRDGKPVRPIEFFGAVPAGERLRAERICRALHLRNYHNNGIAGLELFFNFGSHAHGALDTALAHIDHMEKRLHEIELDTRYLVCEITELEALDRSALVTLAARIRACGIRLAIDDFGAGHSTLERVALVDPEFVKIDGTLFRRIASAPAALRLLTTLVARLVEQGCQVVVEGIETAAQLRAAIDVGASIFQGYLFAQPKLVGSIFPETPLMLDDLVGRKAVVVSLFR